MIPEKKFIEIAKGLLEKTKKRQVDWKQDGSELRSFTVTLPSSAITLCHYPSATQPDKIRLVLLGPKGEKVGDWEFLEGDENWDMAQELFWEAQSSVTGSNRILEDVERFIAGDPGRVRN
jgi:hypothetical protein